MVRSVNFKDYDASKGPNAEKKKVSYFKINVGDKKRVRLIDEPVEFYKYSFKNPDGAWRFVTFNDVDEVNSFCEKYGIEKEKISAKLAINLIDKSIKPAEIKVYEFSYKILGEFAKFQKVSDDAIGGINGMDFELEMVKQGQYTPTKVQPAGKSVIEQVKFDKIMTEYCFDLGEIYKSTPADLVDKIMNNTLGKDNDSHVNTQNIPTSAPDDLGDDTTEEGGDSVPF